MAGTWDASVNVLYITEDGGAFTAQKLRIATAFDVVAEIEIGAQLNGFVTADRLVVTLTNLTTGVVTTQVNNRTLAPAGTTRREPIRVDFPALVANEGDLLRATCSYRATAGINTDYSWGQSEPAIAEP
ncbi:hypothetical protein ACWHLZ_35445 [Streptomyces chartreusis]|jgi:hypothetical protein|uniref:hypothetical protein n=1 Tax=Streptomyces chartreusis TaxID=1969 RepID=UPI002E80B1F9|nr:hypothetical protein [Streptomyces chartreusis]WSZ65703.1 hypothetical protein OG938_07580 [Streptomyces chartreusis]WTA31450.1 hypothetical protein OIA45_37845 [Streptomyces chartreusis]WUB21926.1 hypothetical protein OG997_36690 [Streptomyces chartreusis]